MLRRSGAILLVLLIIAAAVITALHNWFDDRHTGVVIKPDDQRLSALVERIEALEGRGDQAENIGWNADAIAGLNDLYSESATDIDELVKQIGALDVTVSELQAALPGDHPASPALDRIAARVETLEREQQITWSRAQHAHCLAHRALGQDCD